MPYMLYEQEAGSQLRLVTYPPVWKPSGLEAYGLEAASESATRGMIRNLCKSKLRLYFFACIVPMIGRGQGLHSHPWTAFGMHIYLNSVCFVKPNPKFGAKLAIIWGNEHCN